MTGHENNPRHTCRNAGNVACLLSCEKAGHLKKHDWFDVAPRGMASLVLMVLRHVEKAAAFPRGLDTHVCI